MGALPVGLNHITTFSGTVDVFELLLELREAVDDSGATSDITPLPRDSSLVGNSFHSLFRCR